MNLENEDLDEYVPILVMHQFASDFVKVHALPMAPSVVPQARL